MPSLGPRYPATAASLANAGTSENSDAWVNPTNVGADDGSEATITAATYDSPDISELLVASNFGFSIPAGSAIDGIVVEIERRNSAGAASDNRVQLAIGTAFVNLVGTNKADLPTDWPTTVGVATYGSATDSWSSGLRYDQVNSSGFAVFLSAQADAANTDIQVDYIRVTIHYTEPTAVRGKNFPPGRKTPRTRPDMSDPAYPVGPQTFMQALSASVGTVATFGTKAITKILSATVAIVADFPKLVTKTLSATVGTTATQTAALIFNRTLSAIVGTTATMTKLVGKILSSSVGTTATQVRHVSKTLTASVATTATIQALRVFLRTLDATVGTTATFSLQVGKALAATVGTAATFTKQVGKTLAATVLTAASIVADFIPGGPALVARLRTMLGVGE